MALGLSQTAPDDIQQQFWRDPRVIQAYAAEGKKPGDRLDRATQKRIWVRLAQQDATRVGEYHIQPQPGDSQMRLGTTGSPWPIIGLGAAGTAAPFLGPLIGGAGAGGAGVGVGAAERGAQAVYNQATGQGGGGGGGGGSGGLPTGARTGLALLAGILPGLLLRGGGSTPPELQRLLQLSMSQAEARHPQAMAATAGIQRMLPTYAQAGASAPPAPSPTPAPANQGASGGGLPSWLWPILGLAGAEGVQAMRGGTSPIGAILGKIFGQGSAAQPAASGGGMAPTEEPWGNIDFGAGGAMPPTPWEGVQF